MAELNKTTARQAAQALTTQSYPEAVDLGPYRDLLVKMARSGLNIALAAQVSVLELRLLYLIKSLSCVDYTPEEREFTEACIAWMSL